MSDQAEITARDINKLLDFAATVSATYLVEPLGDHYKEPEVTAKGSYKVLNAGEVVRLTTQPFIALEAYHAIKPPKE